MGVRRSSRECRPFERSSPQKGLCCVYLHNILCRKQQLLLMNGVELSVEIELEQDDWQPAMRPAHWRLDLLEPQVERLYLKGSAFFVVEVEPRSAGRVWMPEEPLDFVPDCESQHARFDGLWLFDDPDRLCESVLKLEELELDVTEVLLVSPPSLNGSAEWRCERLAAAFAVCDEYDYEGGWLYIVSTGAVYGDLDPICYLALGSARHMVFRDPRTVRGSRRSYFPLPKIDSIAAIGQSSRQSLAQNQIRQHGQYGRRDEKTES